jgi:hypothetical protein
MSETQTPTSASPQATNSHGTSGSLQPSKARSAPQPQPSSLKAEPPASAPQGSSAASAKDSHPQVLQQPSSTSPRLTALGASLHQALLSMPPEDLLRTSLGLLQDIYLADMSHTLNRLGGLTALGREVRAVLLTKSNEPTLLFTQWTTLISEWTPHRYDPNVAMRALARLATMHLIVTSWVTRGHN